MDVPEIRQFSTHLFGNANRLEAAAAIGRLEGKSISARAIEIESNLDYRRAQEQVAHFAKAGVLVPEMDPGRRTKDYRAIAIPYWRAANELLGNLIELDAIP